MGIRKLGFAVAVGVTGMAMVGCQTTNKTSLAPIQSQQVSAAVSRVATDSSYLADARSHFKRVVYETNQGTHHTATWIVPDAYRGEVIFGEQTTDEFYFVNFDVKAEMQGYRYFGKALTEEIQWGERRVFPTELTRFDVIDFIAIGTDSMVDRCSGFVGYWSDNNKRLSGFICDRTGYEAKYPRAEDFLPTVTVRGEFEEIGAR